LNPRRKRNHQTHTARLGGFKKVVDKTAISAYVMREKNLPPSLRMKLRLASKEKLACPAEILMEAENRSLRNAINFFEI